MMTPAPWGRPAMMPGATMRAPVIIGGRIPAPPGQTWGPGSSPSAAYSRNPYYTPGQPYTLHTPYSWFPAGGNVARTFPGSVTAYRAGVY